MLAMATTLILINDAHHGMTNSDAMSTKIEAGWQHFHHQADIGVEGWGPTLAEAFFQAAIAMTAVITEPTAVQDQTCIEIDCDSPDVEYLFLDWLNSLVYEMATRQMLFSRFEVNIKGTQLRARVCGELVDRERHQPAVEIKGATLTGLSVKQEQDGLWHARCVVDV